jgi:hypothetical protein
MSPPLEAGGPTGLAFVDRVRNLTLVVDGTPQIHPLAGDPHHHLVEVPVIARPWTAPA